MKHSDDDKALFARREFLKTTTGALIVGVGASRIAIAQVPQGGKSALERGVKSGPPDPGEVDSYLAVHPNNTATLFAGYVDLGQGGPTALRQIAAEELDLEFGQVLMASNDTFVTTNGFTAASRTIGIGGVEVRAEAAEARRGLLTLSSERLKAPGLGLTVARGGGSGKQDAPRPVTPG